ncbi:MAG TPA: hypothetical protein VGD42_02650 [Lysobacter sp.]
MNTQPSDARGTSNAKKYLFLFLLGLVIGIFATVMAMRAIQARKDHFPGSVMHVQQWHLGQLKRKVEQNRCSATDVLPNLKALRVMGDDLEAAFPDLADDKRFAEHASRIRARLDAALASPPISCAGVGTTTKEIGEACKACHQDFR